MLDTPREGVTIPGVTTYRQADWYRLPHYYDILLEDDTRLEAAFLERAYERHATPPPRARGRSALEIACGSGRLLVELARRGWRVAGVDLEPEMVRYARERLAAEGLSGTVRAAPMQDFRFARPFDLAHCLISTFRHLLAEADARATLECVARGLRPGGIFVLGLHLTEYGYDRRQRERWVAQRDGTRVVCNLQSWPPDRRRRRERVRARVIVEERDAVERYESSWDFRTYDATQLRRLLRSVPALEHVATYDFAFDERDFDDEQLDLVLVLRRA